MSAGSKACITCKHHISTKGRCGIVMGLRCFGNDYSHWERKGTPDKETAPAPLEISQVPSTVRGCDTCAFDRNHHPSGENSCPRGYPLCSNDNGFRKYKLAPVIAEAPAPSPAPTPAPDPLLQARGSRYGTFSTLSALEQDLKDCVRGHKNWEEKLLPHHRTAIEMILHKVCRVVNGNDPSYVDNWDDIAGYAKLGKEPEQ